MIRHFLHERIYSKCAFRLCVIVAIYATRNFYVFDIAIFSIVHEYQPHIHVKYTRIKQEFRNIQFNTWMYVFYKPYLHNRKAIQDYYIYLFTPLGKTPKNLYWTAHFISFMNYYSLLVKHASHRRTRPVILSKWDVLTQLCTSFVFLRRSSCNIKGFRLIF